MAARTIFSLTIFIGLGVYAWASVPEQIHLAFTSDSSSMAVQWAIVGEETPCSSDTIVLYCEDRDELERGSVTTGSCFPFKLGKTQSHHVAYMTSLKASTKYYYRVGSGKQTEWSGVYNFRSAPSKETLQQNLPQQFLVWGDLSSSVTGPADTPTIMPWASRVVAQGDIDMILHVGDFGYDLHSNNGEVGALFMNEIQNMSAYVPYHVDVGNHEIAHLFAYYTEFFRNQPQNTDPAQPEVFTENGWAPNNWWFSWNVGLVHFVTISSEIYFTGRMNDVKNQWNWLKADLQKANENRTNAPWIIVNAHRSIYCSCDGDCDEDAYRFRAGLPDLERNGSRVYGIEQLLYTGGVDLFLNGHEHNYERMFDVAPSETDPGDHTAGYSTRSTVNPPATTYIVTGDAGNRENHEGFQYEQPARTAYRTDAFGFSRMNVWNNTHLHWVQIECDLSSTSDIGPASGQVVDEFWLVQEKHGSFGVMGAGAV